MMFFTFPFHVTFVILQQALAEWNVKCNQIYLFIQHLYLSIC